LWGAMAPWTSCNARYVCTPSRSKIVSRFDIFRCM
jgi:hypothetical protein